MLCQQDFVKNCVMDELDEFVKKHGGEIERKKTNELTKIADAVEKNKFNLRTSALALKMDP